MLATYYGYVKAANIKLPVHKVLNNGASACDFVFIENTINWLVSHIYDMQTQSALCNAA